MEPLWDQLSRSKLPLYRLHPNSPLPFISLKTEWLGWGLEENHSLWFQEGRKLTQRPEFPEGQGLKVSKSHQILWPSHLPFTQFNNYSVPCVSIGVGAVKDKWNVQDHWEWKHWVKRLENHVRELNPYPCFIFRILILLKWNFFIPSEKKSQAGPCVRKRWSCI